MASLIGCLNAVEAQEKIYVNPASLVVLEEGFFVDINNQMIGFSSINLDEAGMYVLTSHKLGRDWMCSCGRMNNYDSQYCRSCGRWR